MTAIMLAVRAQSAVMTEPLLTVTPGSSATVAFDFPQFDPSLGTLNGAELIFTPVVEIGYDVFNITSTGTTAINPTVSDPNVSLVNTSLGLGGGWSSIQTISSPDFTANPGENKGPVLAFDFGITPSDTILGPAGFDGPDTYHLVLNGSASATPSGTGTVPLFFGFYAEYGGSLGVVYDYSTASDGQPTVPESAAMSKCAGFAALGTLGVSLWRRKHPRAA